jgi:hypothetical protein
VLIRGASDWPEQVEVSHRETPFRIFNVRVCDAWFHGEANYSI